VLFSKNALASDLSAPLGSLNVTWKLIEALISIFTVISLLARVKDETSLISSVVSKIRVEGVEVTLSVPPVESITNIHSDSEPAGP
jgi:hypothetical protein